MLESTFRFLMVTLYTCIVYFIVGLRLPFNYTLVFWLTLFNGDGIFDSDLGGGYGGSRDFGFFDLVTLHLVQW